MRIDLVLAADAGRRAVKAAWVDRHARKGKGPSDHAPVIVDLDEAPDGDIGPVVPPPSAPAKRGDEEASAGRSLVRARSTARELCRSGEPPLVHCDDAVSASGW